MSEFKVMNRPSAAALTTIKAVLILLGRADADLNWETAKKTMVNPKTFIATLSALDKDKIPEKVVKKVTKLTSVDDFHATKAPKAAAVLTQWVLAILYYNKQLKKKNDELH